MYLLLFLTDVSLALCLKKKIIQLKLYTKGNFRRTIFCTIKITSLKRSENKEFKVKVLSLQYCLHNFCNLLRYCLGDFDERGIYGMRQKLLKNALNKKMC